MNTDDTKRHPERSFLRWRSHTKRVERVSQSGEVRGKKLERRMAEIETAAKDAMNAKGGWEQPQMDAN
jgi:hypothetical protein